MAVIIGKYTRVVNIDWLEVFATESQSVSYEPDAFRSRGWYVKERGYGTQLWLQVFTIMDNWGTPLVEIRRSPRVYKEINRKAIYWKHDCYIKLSNVYCYSENPVGTLIAFLEREHYQLKRIFRIDLCIDFVKFDSGDLPKKVASRITRHVYTKKNQTERSVHGDDTWTECVDNWFHWGAAGSMVATRFYNKTKEIRDTKFKKPWILSEWMQAGFIDNATAISLHGLSVDVWRLEFEIKSSAKGWVYVSPDESDTGTKEWLEHTLECYSTPKGILNAIANLIPHYFHWKIYKEGKRKSLCKAKVLFKFSPDEYESGYRLTSESDIFRQRYVEIDNDEKYIRQLARAIASCTNAGDLPTLYKLIQQQQERVNREILKK